MRVRKRGADRDRMTDILLQHFLMYLGRAGLAARVAWPTISANSRLAHRAHERCCRDPLLHLLQFGEVGVPLLAALFLEINAAVLSRPCWSGLVSAPQCDGNVGRALRQRHARRVTPIEQHVHGVLQMVPAVAAAVVAILHSASVSWPCCSAGDADFAVQLKHLPLPGWYLGAVMLGSRPLRRPALR